MAASGRGEEVFGRIGTWSTARPWLTVLGWLAVAGLLNLAVPQLETVVARERHGLRP